MENIDVAKTKSSLYCWIALTVFIAGTLVFMISFYNKAVTEITENTGFHNYQVAAAILDNTYAEE